MTTKKFLKWLNNETEFEIDENAITDRTYIFDGYHIIILDLEGEVYIELGCWFDTFTYEEFIKFWES